MFSEVASTSKADTPLAPASPILAKDRLYFFGMKGEVAVVAVAPQFKVLARGKFTDGFMATPAVIGNTLILRSKSAVYCVE